MLGIYLMFNGNCQDALRLYETAFNTKTLEIKRYSDIPSHPNFPISEDQKNLVLHAKLEIEKTEIMCSDSSRQTTDGNNIYISISTKDENLVKGAWDTLKENGNIHMELQPTFFARLHGSLKDKFGINWMFTVFE